MRTLQIDIDKSVCFLYFFVEFQRNDSMMHCREEPHSSKCSTASCPAEHGAEDLGWGLWWAGGDGEPSEEPESLWARRFPAFSGAHVQCRRGRTGQRDFKKKMGKLVVL